MYFEVEYSPAECCSDCNEPGAGLGFLPALSIAPATGPAAPFVAAGIIIASLIPFALTQIGKGRKEADLITPVQNQVGQRLAEINNAIPHSSVTALQEFYQEVEQLGESFHGFVTDPRFKDGRASVGALDTIMPLIDGTDAAGQVVRPDGGTMGTIARAILALGGQILQATTPIQGSGSAISSLRVPIPGNSFLPQSGFIPPTSPLSPIQNQVISRVGAPGSDVLPWLFAAGAGVLFFAGRKQ